MSGSSVPREHPASRFLREDLVDLKPYHVEPVPHRIKLDANESPYDVPPEIKAEIGRILADLPLNRYPDGEARALKRALAARLGVSEGCLAIGNGSDELIAALILALARPDARVIAPEPTFSMYRILARVAGVEYVPVPLNPDFSLDPDRLRQTIRPEGTHLFFFSYPNNPTGNCWDVGAIVELLVHSNVLVVMDEAYFEFSGKTLRSEWEAHRNLILLRTFSKAYGLAGLRVGYMIADPEWVACVDRVRLPYNVNAFSQAAALALLKHEDRVAEHVATIRRERDRLHGALAEDPRFEPFHSEANFVLFRALEGADAVFRRLVEAGILIRNLDRPGPLSNCLRVTAGTPSENAAFLDALGGDAAR